MLHYIDPYDLNVKQFIMRVTIHIKLIGLIGVSKTTSNIASSNVG